MDKSMIVHKAEETIATLRAALEANDGSAVQATISSIQSGFSMLKMVFFGNDTVKKSLDDVRECFEEFETAFKKGDQKLSTTLLDKAEELVQRFK